MPQTGFRLVEKINFGDLMLSVGHPVLSIYWQVEDAFAVRKRQLDEQRLRGEPACEITYATFPPFSAIYHSNAGKVGLPSPEEWLAEALSVPKILSLGKITLNLKLFELEPEAVGSIFKELFALAKDNNALPSGNRKVRIIFEQGGCFRAENWDKLFRVLGVLRQLQRVHPVVFEVGPRTVALGFQRAMTKLERWANAYLKGYAYLVPAPRPRGKIESADIQCSPRGLAWLALYPPVGRSLDDLCDDIRRQSRAGEGSTPVQRPRWLSCFGPCNPGDQPSTTTGIKRRRGTPLEEAMKRDAETAATAEQGGAPLIIPASKAPITCWWGGGGDDQRAPSPAQSATSADEVSYGAAEVPDDDNGDEVPDDDNGDDVGCVIS